MWRNENDPPEQNDLVIVAAWEFGQAPMLFFARMWQSCLDGQPRQWYLAPELYNLDRPGPIGRKVHFWMPLPDFPKQQPELF